MEKRFCESFYNRWQEKIPFVLRKSTENETAGKKNRSDFYSFFFLSLSNMFIAAPNQIAYLVLSHSSSYHSERAQALRRSILEQQSQLVNFSVSELWNKSRSMELNFKNDFVLTQMVGKSIGVKKEFP